MAENLFTRLRLNRSHYVALEASAALILVAIGFGILYLILPPHHQGRLPIPCLTLLYPLVVCGIPYVALSTCFQAARLRDIGVKPAPILWGIVSMSVIAFGMGLLFYENALAELVCKVASALHVIFRAALVYWPSVENGNPAFFSRPGGDIPHVGAPRSALSRPAHSARTACQGQFGRRGVTEL
jgi:hypothetical protein